MVVLNARECRTSLIVIPFAVDTTEFTPFTKGSHQTRLNTYYGSAIATFATIRRFNPAQECVFATNAAPPDWALRQFKRFDVHIRRIEASSIQRLPPRTIFRTSLYLFDVLRVIVAPPGKAVMFLDPDIICIRPFDLVLSDGQVGCLPLETGAHDSIKGITLTQIAEIGATLGRPKAFVPKHIGGEILTVTHGASSELFERIKEALAYIEGGAYPNFHNEEHILTYASDRNWRSMRSLIARIWTIPRYRDVPEDALNLALWHLPAEKTRGLQRVYRAVRERCLDRLSDDAAQQLLGQWTGVIPTRRRMIGDRIRRTIPW